MKDYRKSWIWLGVYDEADDEAAAKAAAEAKAREEEEARVKAEADKLKLSEEQQKHLNKVIAEEKRRHQQATQKALDEVAALRTKVKLTDQERRDLDKRLEKLQQDSMTKEELAKREREKTIKKYETDIRDLTKERDTWQSRYQTTLIDNSITQEAVKAKAYNPNQILAILKPQVVLEDDVDSDGNATGKHVPKVNLPDVDKEGKSITLKLSVADALKRMAEREDSANLFAQEGSGGLGHRGSGGHQEVDIRTLAKDAAKYREAKAKGQIKLD